MKAMDKIFLFQFAVLAALAPTARALADNFEFVALGDTAYCPEIDNDRYERLIELINAADPAFSIHVGDIGKTDKGACTEELRQTVLRQFGEFDHPLIYTPGDNEWTDCVYDADPLEQLDRLRAIFFNEPTSLGSKTLPVARQSDESDFEAYVENLRWEHDGVLFATLHVVGSHNGLDPGIAGSKVLASEAALLEYHERNRANLQWIERTFEAAAERGSKAVVVIFQADVYHPSVENSPAFRGVRRALARHAGAFPGQVLIINGDSHRFLIDKPLMTSRGPGGTQTHMNVTRLVVYGDPNVRAVKVTVDTDTPWVFGFEPLFEAGERRSEEEQLLCNAP